MYQEGVLARCAVCNQLTQKRCARCLSIYYCDTEHQRSDWRRHKSECLPKLIEPEESWDKTEENIANTEVPKTPNEVVITEASVKKEDNTEEGSANVSRRSKKSKKKRSQKKAGSEKVSDRQSQDSAESKQSDSALETSRPGPSTEPSAPGPSTEPSAPEPSTEPNPPGPSTATSVISSVVHTDEDLEKVNAITYEGSSEKEILSEQAQQLSAVEYVEPLPTASTSNVLRAVNRTDTRMPESPGFGGQPHGRKEYPGATLRGSAAPFSGVPNSYQMDPSDSFYDICHRLIRDMTQYGVCVLDNFFGRERGNLVLQEVLNMYRSGIFQAGRLVSNPGSTEAQTVRSDRITWIDGREPHCTNIKLLVSQVDNIVLRANRMANNGKMGDYVINGRTKAMVACYPGSGSHYVKHVDNPNKDGRCITAIYYLNQDWDVKTCGGLLRVFPEGTNQVADIAPIFDRMLFFWSDRRNPHEVQPAYSTRYAITLWYFDAHERQEARRQFREQGQSSSSK